LLLLGGFQRPHQRHHELEIEGPGFRGGVPVVLAQDCDRFAREPAYLYLLREEFGDYGISIMALNQQGGDSPESELTDGILDQLAKYERAKIAERTRRGKLKRARKGKVIPTHTPDYGFRYTEDREGYEVDPEKMVVVRRIFELVGRHHEEELARLEDDRDAILKHYAGASSEALDSLTPEQRHNLYKSLRIEVFVHADGGTEIMLGDLLSYDEVCTTESLSRS